MKETGDGEILKMADFGVSKILKKDETLNTCAGTKSVYMSPQVFASSEQYKKKCEDSGKDPIDPKYTYKADIWSLGVLLLEIITRDLEGLLPEDTTYFKEMDKDKIQKFMEKIPGERLSNDINDLLKFIREKMVVREEKYRASLKEVIDHELFKKHYDERKEENSKASNQKVEKKFTKAEVI